MMKYVHPSRRRGLSLIEVLVAVALTLIVLLGVVQMFGYVSKEVSRGRAGMELAGNNRAVVQTIRNDLDGVTVTVKPWPTTGSGEGYLEYSEFAAKDNPQAMISSGFLSSEIYPPASSNNLRDSFLFGDFDDVVAFTARSRTEPFRGVLRGALTGPNASGKFQFTPGTGPVVIESTTAEIVYFTTFDDVDGDGAWEPLDGEVRKLHRRVFLVRPDIVVVNQTIPDRATLVAFRQANDLSINVTHNGTNFVASSNSLADLTRRENRFGRVFSATAALPFSSPFPHQLETLDSITSQAESGPATGPFLADYALQGDRLGEDVIATNLAAFDVRVFDPLATAHNINGRVLQPGDFAYNPTAGPAVFQGCFTDLAHPGVGNFVGGNQPKSQIGSRPTYCTWSQHYEYDGVNQDGDADSSGNPLFDEGTNDVDDNNSAGVDDPSEMETSPPYNHPVRAMQITIRVFDTRTHQIRQSSVVSNFTPE